MTIPNLIVERDKRKSDEGYVQYILAALIAGDKPPGHNKPFKPSEVGVSFLRKLDRHCFGGGAWADPPEVYWEFRLKAKKPDQDNRWPDLAAVWPERVVLLELKTKPGSVREGQVDEQIELGLHNYPKQTIDMIYITCDVVDGSPALSERSSYANTTWEEIASLLDQVWTESGRGCEEIAIVRHFAEYLVQTMQARSAAAAMDSGSQVPRAEAPLDIAEWLDRALAVALRVEKSGKQGALAIPLPLLEDPERFRDLVRDSLRRYNRTADEPILHVDPWVWREATSGGKARTEAGRECGMELRFSFFTAGNRL